MATPGASQPSNPSGEALLTRVDVRAKTQLAIPDTDVETSCSKCQKIMGPEERFCAGCGQLRDGLDPTKYGRIESKTEAAWREIQEKLQRATAGRYLIVRELGRGGMAAVYLAQQEGVLKRQVAIKVMRPSFLLDEGMVDRFMREARTMASLSHPNIVTIHAVEEVEELYFFVMQFIPGLPLDEVIRQLKQLPVAAVQAILFQAAGALGSAHRQGVIHRDVKPANIMLDRDGNAIVTDFGIAKVADQQATALTAGPMGTPLYMSPEQCAGTTSVTAASDQYSLANVGYELLTGQPPFLRETPMALGVAIMTEKPKPIRQFRTDCPPDFEAAIMKMLAKKPEDRFANLAEAAAAFGGEVLADDDPTRAFLQGIARREARSSGRHLTPKASRSGVGIVRGWTGLGGLNLRRWVVVGGLGGLGVLSLAGYYMFGRRPVPVAPADGGRPPGPSIPPAPPPVPPAPAPPVPPPPATDDGGQAERDAEIQRLVGSARKSIAAKDWRNARVSLTRADGIQPGNAEVQRLVAQVTLGQRQDSAKVIGSVPPAPPPLPSPPGPPDRTTDSTAIKPGVPVRKRHEQEIRKVIDDYVRAINARALGGIRAVYPSLTSDQEKEWQDRFAPEVKRLVAAVSVRSIEETGDGGGAEAAFDLSLRIEPEGGKPLDFKIKCAASIKNIGGTWKIISLTEQGS